MTDAAGELVKYDAMCRAINAAYEVDEVKDIRDKAIALEVYARQAHNLDAERRASQIRLRAERKVGAISAQLEKAQGKRVDRLPPTMGRSSKADQLRKAGVSPKQAEQWEKLAAVPTEQFNAALSDPTTMPSTSGIIRAMISRINSAPPDIGPRPAADSEEDQERAIDRMKEAWAELSVASQTRFLSWARDNKRRAPPPAQIEATAWTSDRQPIVASVKAADDGLDIPAIFRRKVAQP
jgi:hypothetical protein